MSEIAFRAPIFMNTVMPLQCIINRGLIITRWIFALETSPNRGFSFAHSMEARLVSEQRAFRVGDKFAVSEVARSVTVIMLFFHVLGEAEVVVL